MIVWNVIFKNQIKSIQTVFRKWISWLGLTRSEASFILFLSVAASVGAWIPEITRNTRDGSQDKSAMDTAINGYFRMISVSDIPDSARVDSLMAYFGQDTGVKARWEKRSDTLREMFRKGMPRSAVESYIAESGDEPVRKVNINTANAQTLTSLPGIGPKMAERIIAYREQKGPFRSADDLMKVKGIGKKTFAKLKPYIDI